MLFAKIKNIRASSDLQNQNIASEARFYAPKEATLGDNNRW